MIKTRQTLVSMIFSLFYMVKNYIKREYLRYQFKKEMKSFYKSPRYVKYVAEHCEGNYK